MPVTSIGEWRERNKPVEVKLPSGNVALVRRVHILDMVAQGQIPSTLLAKARDYAKGGKQADPAALGESLELIHPVIKAAFVEPRVADQGSEDALGLDEISGQDKLAVFKWCNAGVEDLQPFFRETGAGVEPVPAGEPVRDEAE